jgi:peptidyl-prolyl cis-trans isomerase SurA
MPKMNKVWCMFALVIMWSSVTFAQQTVPDVPDNQVEPEESVAEMVTKKDTVNNFKRIKLDGIAAVVGDYVILDSDIEKKLIDLRSQ